MVLLLFFYLYISGDCSVKGIFWEMADFFYDENIDLMGTRVNLTNTFRECIILSSFADGPLVIQNFHIGYTMYLSIIS